jgi:hypothetical protein
VLTAFLSSSAAHGAGDPPRIALRSGAIDTRPSVEAQAADDTAGSLEDEIVLIQFPGPPTAAQLDALHAAAVRVYTYLPDDAFLVKMPAGWRQSKARTALGASWTGPYRPESKISPAIADIAGIDPDKPEKQGARQVENVLVQVFPDADLRDVVEQIHGLGVERERIAGWRTSPYFSRVRLLLTPAEVAEVRDGLARLPEIFWIDLEPRRSLLNDTTVWVGQSGLHARQATPVFQHGLYGQGQTIAILDTGLDADMCFFRDPARGLPPINACNGGTTVDPLQRKVLAVDFLWADECSGGITAFEWDTHGHGTHVAGIAAGDDFAHPLAHDHADGMAPGAKLVIQDGGLLPDDCSDLPGIGCPVVDLNPLFQQSYDQGARFHSDSWGDNENAAVQNNYTAGSQDVDEFIWSHKDFLIFFAAGNSGSEPGSVISPSTAKNGVSVGATLRGNSADSMASFSSCGPTADGRIKPDVTVPGSDIISASDDFSVTSNNCGSMSDSGTSMATPGAAGFTALIRQYFTDGWYPSGTRVPTNGSSPSAALLKAMLVNSAADMTDTAPIPASCQGWGRVLLDDALFFQGDARRLWVRDDQAGFPRGSSNEGRTFSFTVDDPEPLKVTLAWSDFPSTPAASVNLVNDLDLIVTGPSGTVWRGNVFSGGRSVAGGTADRRNNLEQVLLPHPAKGTYTVTVRSATVPEGPQPYALVVTGDVEGDGGNTLFFDDFEKDRGWTVNPDGHDTARSGRWERGHPEPTRSQGRKQLGGTVSGTNVLVTGRLAGSSAAANDVDGGVTTILSPPIQLPEKGTLTLSLSYYFAHGKGSSPADFFRVRVVGAQTSTVLEELGTAGNENAHWKMRAVDLTASAGQTIRLRIEAADGGPDNLVEAAVEDVQVTDSP